MNMTDIEITRWTAEAMGLHGSEKTGWPIGNTPWNPLHDKAQAMALVESFELTVIWSWSHQCGVYCKPKDDKPIPVGCPHTDLLRAICECVAKMQAEAQDAPAAHKDITDDELAAEIKRVHDLMMPAAHKATDD
jgi:hypothetical protein